MQHVQKYVQDVVSHGWFVPTCSKKPAKHEQVDDDNPQVKRLSFAHIDAARLSYAINDESRPSQQYEQVGEPLTSKCHVVGETGPTSTFKDAPNGMKRSVKQQSTKRPAQESTHVQNAYSEVDVPKAVVFSAQQEGSVHFENSTANNSEATSRLCFRICLKLMKETLCTDR